MKLRSLFLAGLIAMELACVFSAQAEEDEAVAARSSAFELAGAFSANDGYKLRDGFYSVALKPGESKVFKVNLYAGNGYWFCVATAPAATKMEVLVFDETGKPLPIQMFSDGGRAAAGLMAGYSGSYYVKFSLPEGTTSSTACLLYAYK